MKRSVLRRNRRDGRRHASRARSTTETADVPLELPHPQPGDAAIELKPASSEPGFPPSAEIPASAGRPPSAPPSGGGLAARAGLIAASSVQPGLLPWPA